MNNSFICSWGLNLVLAVSVQKLLEGGIRGPHIGFLYKLVITPRQNFVIRGRGMNEKT